MAGVAQQPRISNVQFTGKIASLIIEESKKIGEDKNPSFWIHKHFEDYFKGRKKIK